MAPDRVAADSLVKTFYIRSYGGKCLDFGAPPQVSGSPVFIYGCNGTIAQHVRIEEPPEPGTWSSCGPARRSLASSRTTSSSGQCPILGTRSVRKPRSNCRTKRTATPCSPGVGNLRARRRQHHPGGQSRLHRQSAEQPGREPHAAGARAPEPRPVGVLDVYCDRRLIRSADDRFRERASGERLRASRPGSSRGTVIEVDPDASVDLTGRPHLEIPTAGVTIRGDRRGTRLGPELNTTGDPDGTMLEIKTEDVRITGLRLRGPSRTTDEDVPFGTRHPRS